MHSNNCSVLGDIPRGFRDPSKGSCEVSVVAAISALLCNTNASSAMVTTQNMPSQMNVCRHPTLSKKNWSMGGQIAPARKFPLAHMATASPRRLVNHREISATSGANAAEVPRNPTNSPCAALNNHRLPASPAATNPSPRLTALMSTGIITPKRSASRPIRTLPMAKPVIVSAYASDASERVTPNSSCIGRSATDTEYIPTVPIVPRARQTHSRSQA